MVRLMTAFCILAASATVALAENAPAYAGSGGGVQIAANASSNPMDANAMMRRKKMKSHHSMGKGMSGDMNNGMSGGTNNGMSGGMNNGMKKDGMGNNGMSK